MSRPKPKRSPPLPRSGPTIPHAGGKFDPQFAGQLNSQILFHDLVAQEARRKLFAGFEAIHATLEDQGIDDKAPLYDKERAALNDLAIKVQEKMLDLHDAIDEWHGLMVAISDHRRQRTPRP